MQNHLKDEIHNVISGKVAVRHGAVIQAAARYLSDGEAEMVRMRSTSKDRKQRG